MKRGLIIALVLVLLAAAGIGAALLYRNHMRANVRGSSTVEYVPTEPKPRPVEPKVEWEMFGYDPTRRSVGQFAGMRPPYRHVWTSGGPALVEFPPVVGFGRLYFADGAGRIYAISARTGGRAWVFSAHRAVAATPALGPYKHGTLYESFLGRLPARRKHPNDGEIVAVSVGNGHLRWRTRVGASETSPLLLGKRLYVGGWDGRIYALDSRTGKHLWAYRTKGAVKGGIAASGGRLYVGSYDGHVYALTARSGKRIWRASGKHRLFGHGRFYAAPVVAYGRVYIGSTDGNVYSFGATSGKLRWSHRTGGYVYGSAAVWHQRVLVGSYDHHFYAFDAATGDVKWKFKANGPISGSATVIDGIVYFATLKGRSYALSARTGRRVWSYPRGKYAPAVSDGERLYVVGYSAIYGLRPARR